MKKLAIILALMLFQTQIAAVAANANYNKKPAQKTQETKPVSQKTKDTNVYKQDGSDYLLKYNINDLESAPWLNEGKRKI